MKRGTHRHWKVDRLTKLLKISRPLAVGHLQMLWEWVGEFTDEGDITRCSAEACAGAGWEGPHDVFLDALVNSHLLDRQDSQLVIHDWLENCEEYIRKRVLRRRTTADNGRQRQTLSESQTENGGLPIQPHTIPSNTIQPHPSFGDVVDDGLVFVKKLTDRGLTKTQAELFVKQLPPWDLREVVGFFDVELGAGRLKRPSAALRDMLQKPVEKWAFERDSNGRLFRRLEKSSTPKNPDNHDEISKALEGKDLR